MTGTEAVQRRVRTSGRRLRLVRRHLNVLCAIPGVGLALLTAGAILPGAQPVPFVSNLLQQQRFSAADLQALAAGEAVVKTLDTPIRRELAHLGVVHIDTPPERFVDRFRDVERFERGPGIPQIGRLSVPPRPEELSPLTVPVEDITALENCRPGHCDVKLSSAAIARFRSRVNWSSPSAAPRAQVVLRAMILELVRAYQANGDTALGSYDDHREPLVVADEFRALVASGNRLPLAIPGLVTYLQEYPRSRPSDAEDFFYWSMVDFGLKQTLRVNHVVIQALAAGPSGVSHVIAIKQLYATHYFQTTLELRFLVRDERQAGRPGFYLVSITRSRIDGTGGLTGALVRSVVSRRSRSAVRGYLEHLKRQVERGPV